MFDVRRCLAPNWRAFSDRWTCQVVVDGAWVTNWTDFDLAAGVGHHRAPLESQTLQPRSCLAMDRLECCRVMSLSVVIHVRSLLFLLVIYNWFAAIVLIQLGGLLQRHVFDSKVSPLRWAWIASHFVAQHKARNQFIHGHAMSRNFACFHTKFSEFWCVGGQAKTCPPRIYGGAWHHSGTCMVGQGDYFIR